MKPTLIIIDDMQSIRLGMRQALQNDFEIVAEGSDGQEAIELCRQHAPQLMVIDVVMPKMSGIEATRQILENRLIPHPKIIVVSGLKDDSVVLQALEAGVCDYLFKPVDTDRLRKVLWGFARNVA